MRASIPAAVTGWGGPLLLALAHAVDVPGVTEVWIRYGDDGAEEKLTGGRTSYRTLAGAEDGDVVLVVGSAVPLSRTLHDSGGGGGGNRARGGGEARPLPDGEQRFKRLGHLIIKEPIPLLIQKVRPADDYCLRPRSCWELGGLGFTRGSSGSR